MAGVVVHARRGERERYAPVDSVLCPSAAPVAMLEAMLNFFPFDTVYIADLDAIRRVGNHDAIITNLTKRFPSVQFWIDAGISDMAALREFSNRHEAVAVIGSESLHELNLLASLPSNIALSIDMKDGKFLGQREIFDRADWWPERILAMNLSRVGSGEGPDLALIQALQQRRPDVSIYAAGGVRNAGDLSALANINAAGALIATALHEGQLSSAELALHSKK